MRVVYGNDLDLQFDPINKNLIKILRRKVANEQHFRCYNEYN